jgi:hypothetical protein
MQQAIIVWPEQGLSGAVAGQKLGRFTRTSAVLMGKSCFSPSDRRFGMAEKLFISRMARSSRLLIALKRATERFHLLVGGELLEHKCSGVHETGSTSDPVLGLRRLR